MSEEIKPKWAVFVMKLDGRDDVERIWYFDSEEESKRFEEALIPRLIKRRLAYTEEQMKEREIALLHYLGIPFNP
jgi:hypothetical protein